MRELSKESESLIFTVVFALVAMVVLTFMSGCSSMEVLRPIEGNNCVDWVNAHKVSTDRLIYGKYLPEKRSNINHIWIEREGECYDNMMPGGFNFSDSDYIKKFEIDQDDDYLMGVLLANRG